MKKATEDRIREWINTATTVITLILVIVGMILGGAELMKININLNEISNFTAENARINSLKTERIENECPENTYPEMVFEGSTVVIACKEKTT